MQQTRENEVSERIEYFDILRALAIFGVVAIHSSSTGLQFSDNSFNFNFTVLWRNLLNFSVPMFLAISGFFLAKKKIKSSRDYFSFLKKQIPRVYIPLLIWSLVWLGLAVLIQNKSVIHEIIKLAIFQSSGPYYFIALIIQYYLLIPIIKRLASNRGGGGNPQHYCKHGYDKRNILSEILYGHKLAAHCLCWKFCHLADVFRPWLISWIIRANQNIK